MTAEITDEDRDAAMSAIGYGGLNPSYLDEDERAMVEGAAQALADQRQRLTVVDLYDEGDSIDLSYGTPPEIEDPIANLICYTFTLPSGHIIRLAPWQLRSLATAIEAENP